MKKKLLSILPMIVMTVVLVSALISCGASEAPGDDFDFSDGESAYEIAVKNGYEGTEEEWLLSLVGKAGQNGIDGKAGQNGKDGKNGQDGEDGADGISITGVTIDAGGNLVIAYSDGTSTSVGKVILEGETPRFRTEKGKVEWRMNDTSAWQELFSVPTTEEKETHTVQLVTEGACEITQISVLHGERTILPIPTKEGSTFEGWFTGDTALDTVVTSYTPIVCDLVLYAKFSSTKYVVNYYVDGVFFGKQEYGEGESIVPLTNPTQDSKVFSGWKSMPSKMPKNNIDIFGSFENAYTVIFKDYDNTVLSTQAVVNGADAVAPTQPTRNGYTFLDWNGTFEDITEDTVIIARYTRNSYSVTFVDYDGETLSEQTVLFGDGATCPDAPTREGYDFAGWDTAFSYISSDITVTATYTEKTKEECTSHKKGTFAVKDGDVYYVCSECEEKYQKVSFEGVFVLSSTCADVIGMLNGEAESLGVDGNVLFSAYVPEFSSSTLEEVMANGKLQILLNGTDCYVSIVLIEE